MSIQDLEAEDSPAKVRARTMLSGLIQRTQQERASIIQQVLNVSIVDRLVAPAALDFGHRPSTSSKVTLTVRGREDIPVMRIHRHALGQIAEKSGIGRRYSSKLWDNDDTWSQLLLVTNLNTLFQNVDFSDRRGETRSFLLRAVGDQLRGFQGHNYNRTLTTSRLLPTFLEECTHFDAGPIGVTATDVCVSVRFALPYVFEPIPGEYVAFGADFKNSDFGAGRLTVAGSVLRVMTGYSAVFEDSFSRTHLGPVIKESDIELSEETENAQLTAVRGALRDVIRKLFSYETLEKNVNLIKLAHEHEIPWSKMREQLRKILTQKETEVLDALLNKRTVVDLPPINADAEGNPVPTAWWASNALSWLADHEKSPDREIELREVAGGFLG